MCSHRRLEHVPSLFLSRLSFKSSRTDDMWLHRRLFERCLFRTGHRVLETVYLLKAEVPGLLPGCSLFAAASEPPLVPMMQATWQSGHSLAQTVYACLYLHMPERTAPNAILHAYCKMARSTCNLVRTLVCVADIHEVGETGSVILEHTSNG